MPSVECSAGQLQRIGERRQAEVDDPHAVLGQDQVARLDVAVHDALRVRLGQAVGDLRRDVERLVHGERSRREPLLQRLAVVVRHDDEQLPVGGGLDVVDGADVRMVGGRGRLRLAHEALLRASSSWLHCGGRNFSATRRPSFVSRAW